MADMTLVTDNYFTTASETFADNLSGSILAGAATVPVNSAAEYATGESVVLTVEPGTANEATFIGKKDTTNQFIECVWTEGNTAVGHNAGATIIDYDSATHHNAQSKGIGQFANQDGTLITQAVRDALGLGADAVNGWEVLPYTLTVASGYNKGNKSFDMTVANNDLTDELSPGMRLRLQRNTAAPTQCMDLERSSSQYAQDTTVSGISFTDDATCEAWIRLESYGFMAIVSRYNGTSGWGFELSADGQVTFIGYNAGAANYSYTQSIQSIPLGQWVHVAAVLDMSTFTTAGSPVYINGTSVPVRVVRGGTNPTALVQAGNLQIGAENGGSFFDGKIADVRIWNAARTATQIRDNMNQQLVGSETNLVGYWKLNGNLNDSTSNANNLTGSGGAVATNTDNPMRTTEYAIVQSVTYSAPNTTINVYTGNDNNIPNMTLTAPYYSTQKAPYLFPAEKENWRLETIVKIQDTIAIGAINTWWVGKTQLTVPIGKWLLGYQGTIQVDSSAGGTRSGFVTLDSTTTPPTNADTAAIMVGRIFTAAAVVVAQASVHKNRILNLTAAETFAIYTGIDSATGVESSAVRGDQGPTIIYAENGYI